MFVPDLCSAHNIFTNIRKWDLWILWLFGKADMRMAEHKNSGIYRNIFKAHENG